MELQPRPARERELRRRIERSIDTGYGACWLQDPRIGRLVEDAILFFDGDRYHTHTWVVMPNHVHVVLTPSPTISLSVIVGSWKSFSAKEANKRLGRTGAFWHEDYYDRFIRDESHMAAAVEYVENNPVKAGLCGRPEEWPFGSARRHPGTAGVPPALPARHAKPTMSSQLPDMGRCSGRDGRGPRGRTKP